MKNKALSLILALALILTLLPAGAFAADASDSITAYVTISIAGSIPVGTDKTDGSTPKLMAMAPVSVTDQNSNGKFDIDDALTAAHERYSSNGIGDYAKSGSGSLAKLWGLSGAENGVGGFYIDDGYISTDLFAEIHEGSRVAAFTYANKDKWSDSYAFFDRSFASVAAGGALKLTLSGSSWGSTSLVSGAKLVLLNASSGDITDIEGKTTDENGDVSLSFEDAGDYIVSAKPASGYITAPVCKVSVLSAEAAKNAIDADAALLTAADLGAESELTKSLSLPAAGTSGNTTVTWESSDTSVISDSGNITRTDNEGTATLTATVGMSGTDYTATRQISVTVAATDSGSAETAKTAMDAVKSAITFNQIKGNNEVSYAICDKLNLPSYASYGNGSVAFSSSSAGSQFRIDWSSANKKIASSGGITQSIVSQAEILTAVIRTIGDYDGLAAEQTLAFALTILDWNHYFSNGEYCGRPLRSVVLDNIAATYQSQQGILDPWVAADMAAANKVGAFGDSGYSSYSNIEHSFSSTQKQAFINAAISALANESVSSGNLSKYIIALSALGYDARDLTTASGAKFDAVSKLTAKVSTETSIYTLPYMLIALQQFGATYKTQTDVLVEKIVNTEHWGYGATDADCAGPALLALAPYYKNASYSNVTDAVDTQIEALKNNISLDENGTVVSYGSPSAESTAMLIVGLSAVGQSVTSFIDKSLEQGLLVRVEDTGKAFKSSYDAALTTEQGFRALTAVCGASSNKGAYRIYDFSGNTLAPAEAKWNACPVIFSVVPADAQVTISGQTAVYSNCFDLKEGSYNYTASKAGYQTKTGTLTVSSSDETNHTQKSVTLSLSSEQSGSTSYTVNFTLVGDTDHDDTVNHVYKQDKGSGRTWIGSQSVSVSYGSSAFDVFDKVLGNAGYKYDEKNESYIVSITNPEGLVLSELTNGAKSGWMYMVNGVSPNVGIRDYKVSNGDSIVFFYTDDYTKETSSEKWSSSSDTSSSFETLTPTVTAKNGKAEISIGTDAIKSALLGDTDKIVIAPKISGSVETVSVAIPATAVKTIAEKSSVTLNVETNCGSVSIPSDTLTSVCKQAGGSDIQIKIETKSTEDVKLPETELKNAAIVEISISSNGKNITTFDGGSLIVFIPVTGDYTDGETYKVIVISADGTAETLVGKVTVINGSPSVKVTISHLSTFVVTNISVAVFADVGTDAWYYDAVQYAAQNGIMKGTSETEFAPNAEVSRAMLVTVLYRLEGAPQVTSSLVFTDVEKNAWYTDAIAWANANGIVKGRDNDIFGIRESVTREEAAVILHRYAAFKKLNVSKTTELYVYGDSSGISSWAQNAMRWANAVGFIKGTSENTISPKGSMTRAQTATVLMRLYDYTENTPKNESSDIAADTAAYMLKTVSEPQMGSIGGEWAVIGLVRSGYKVPQTWLDNYYTAVEKSVTECKGVLSNTKYTEYSRVIIALTAIGKAPNNVGGYDLTAYLADYKNVVKQGINGAVWALIALDSGNYDIPKNAKAEVQATREMYINEILSKQLSDGGFSLTGQGSAGIDLTAMALCALSPYKSEAEVSSAVDKAVKYLSEKQEKSGAYASCCESTAQVIIALCSLGISADDSRFVKNGCTMTDGLLSFNAGSGQFRHTNDGEVNQMATEQALLALTALQRAENGESTIYNISGAK